MTESQWLACSEPWNMLKSIQKPRGWAGGWSKHLFGWLGKKHVVVSDRKLQMLVIAYCRRHDGLLTDERDKRTLKISESYTEGLVGIEELGEGIRSCSTFGGIGCHPSLAWNVAVACLIPHEKIATQSRAEYALERIHHAVGSIAVSLDDNPTFPLSEQEHMKLMDTFASEAKTIVNLLYEIIGNPFHPVSLNPSWLTSTVLTLATGIYSEKAFDRMPILADALQDAGCDNEDILDHCRQHGEHCRGCWCVDLILGKS